MKKFLLVWALALLAGPVHAQPSNTFTSPTARFSLTKPSDWQFLSADQNAANLKAVDMDDAEMKAALAKYATTPLVAITKHAEPYADLNPSFKVNIRPLGQFAGADPKAIISALLPSLQRMFSDAKVVEGPSDVAIGGLKGGYVRLDYTLRTNDGATFPTSSELWIVPRGDFFFMMGAGTRQDEATGRRSEIRSIVEGIKFGS